MDRIIAAETVTPSIHWKAALGWGPLPPAPTIEELLPIEVLQKFLDIWHATGANLLLFKAHEVLEDFRTVEGYHREVMDILETDVMERMDGVIEKWNAQEEAAFQAMERGAA